MANITRRGGDRPAPQQPELVRRLRDLFDWDPFAEMMPYVGRGEAGLDVDFDVKETKDAYVFKADLPGVKEQDIDLSLTGNRLTISGKREREEKHEDERMFTWERSWGSFTRSFTLPEGVDAEHVSADLRDGVLTVNVPKTPETQPKKISIGAQQQPSGGKAKA